MESKSHCLGLFHPTESLLLAFFFSQSLLAFLPKCIVGMWQAIKSTCKQSRAEQNPYDALLIPTSSFDYATIILCLCEEGGLINPVM